MIEYTLSFSDLTHTQARTMAVDNNCESSYDGPYHDFTAWFDHRDEADTWAAELFKYGKNIGATMVALIVDEVNCSCQKIPIRMSCSKCNYPISEALVTDDGEPCTCTACCFT